jgi:outer membrane autotransporter protein
VLTSALLKDSRTQAESLLEKLSGDEAPVGLEVAENNVGQTQDLIAQRVSANGIDHGNTLWAAAAGQHDSVDGDSSLGSTGWQDTSAELAIGYEHATGATTKAGVAAAFNNDDVSFNSRNATSHVDGVQAVLYGAWMPAKTAAYVMGEVGFGYSDNSLHRTVNDGSAPETASGSFDTLEQSLYAEAGLNLETKYGSVKPYIGLRAAHVSQNGFSESGGGVIDLNVGNMSDNALSSVMGVRFASLQRSLFGKAATFTADASWEHRLDGSTNAVQAAFVSNPTQSWEALATPADRDMARLSLGGTWQASKTTSVFGKVVGEVGAHSADYGVQAGVQWKW